ncbi:hypothetical protein [Nocardiopsis alba]|uniref:hypothetical protein n=1 Tax=Nocardiopsis alba TaxID=53437 RepID=UPI0035D67760
MAGFHVDLYKGGDTVRSPAGLDAGTTAEELRTAAQVVEMLLIKEDSRMRLDATTPYDGTHGHR